MFFRDFNIHTGNWMQLTLENTELFLKAVKMDNYKHLCVSYPALYQSSLQNPAGALFKSAPAGVSHGRSEPGAWISGPINSRSDG